ncbi:unnamed protein product [Closterium sp. NIES-64]|nr:unnamed protein product [Closterium sp. NIES-64]
MGVGQLSQFKTPSEVDDVRLAVQANVSSSSFSQLALREIESIFLVVHLASPFTHVIFHLCHYVFMELAYARSAMPMHLSELPCTASVFTLFAPLFHPYFSPLKFSRNWPVHAMLKRLALYLLSLTLFLALPIAFRPSQVLMELARARNAVPIPPIAGSGLFALPPEAECLLQPNVQIAVPLPGPAARVYALPREECLLQPNVQIAVPLPGPAARGSHKRQRDGDTGGKAGGRGGGGKGGEAAARVKKEQGGAELQDGKAGVGGAKVYTEFCKGAVERAVAGCRAVVLLYGQTGTGKTHTISGSNVEAGVFHHAMADVFRAAQSDDVSHLRARFQSADVNASDRETVGTLEQSTSVVQRQPAPDTSAAVGNTTSTLSGDGGSPAANQSPPLLCFLSVVEIYNERAVDLLQGVKPSSVQVKENGSSRSDSSKSTSGSSLLHAAGRKLITEQQLHSVEEAAVAFELAGQRRKVRGTNRNKQSSRSHMLYVFRIRRTLPVSGAEGKEIVVEGNEGQYNEGLYSEGMLYLVDLAGSESCKGEDAATAAAAAAGETGTGAGAGAGAGAGGRTTGGREQQQEGPWWGGESPVVPLITGLPKGPLVPPLAHRQKQYQQTQQQYKEQQGKNAQRQQQQRQQRQVGGSRRVGQREARRRETESINKSLLALTSVLTHLSQARPGLPPYRRSLLTRLLQPCLGGRSGSGSGYCAVLFCIDPQDVHVSKTTLSSGSGGSSGGFCAVLFCINPQDVHVSKTTLRFSALTRRIRMEYHPLALLSPTQPNPSTIAHSFLSLIIPLFVSPRYSAMTRRIRMDYRPSILSLSAPKHAPPVVHKPAKRRPAKACASEVHPHSPTPAKRGNGQKGVRTGVKRVSGVEGKRVNAEEGVGGEGKRGGTEEGKEEQGEKVEEEVRVVVEEREEKGLEERSREGGKGSGDEGGGAAEMLLAAGGAVDALLGAGVDVSSESGSSDCDGASYGESATVGKERALQHKASGDVHQRSGIEENVLQECGLNVGAAAVACEGEAAGEAVLEWYNGYGDYSDKENANSDYAVTTQAHVEQMGLGVCAAATGAAAAAAAFDPSYFGASSSSGSKTMQCIALDVQSRGDGEEEGDADEGEGVFGEAGICLKQVEKGEGWRKMDPKGHRVIAGEDGAAENAKGNLGNRKKLKERAVVLQRWLAMAYVCFSSQDGVGAVL